MDRKLRCIEPRYLVLLIASVIFLPLRDSFQTGVVNKKSPPPPSARCSMHQLPIRSTGCARLLTRQFPRLLRPLKGSESEEDVSGNGERFAAEDDSMKVVPNAREPAAATAAAASDPAETTAEEDDGEDPTEGEI